MNFIPNPHPHRAQGRQSQHHVYKILISYRPTAIDRVNCPVILHCCQCLSSILLFAKFWEAVQKQHMIDCFWIQLQISRGNTVGPRGNTAPTVLPQMHYCYRGSTVHSVPSPRYYREILPIPTCTAFPLPCNSLRPTHCVQSHLH